MDADTFGERCRRAIEEVVHFETSGWALDLVARASEQLKPFVDGPPRVVLIPWLEQTNAFTLPGRYVYICRQLLSRGLSEAGVAFVIAHEIGHHALGHFEAAIRILEYEDNPFSVSGMKALVASLVAKLRFGPKQEVDADRFALALCERAGYGAAAANDLFDALERELLDFGHVDDVFGYEEENLDATFLERIVDFLGQTGRTHPSLMARRQALFGAPPPLTETPAAGTGVAAVGMVFACARCAVRFSATNTCPQCGSGNVLDLREPAQRQQILRAMFRRAPVTPRRKRALATIAVGGPAAAFLTYLLVTGTGLAVALGGAAVLAWIVTLVYLFVSRVGQEAHDLAVPSLSLEPVAVHLPLLTSGAEDAARGHVHVRRAVRAPVSGRACAAWRVAGEGPGGAIDDADLGGFDLLRDGRVIARIDAPSGFVDLGPMGAATPHVVEGALADFLRVRGALRAGARCTLAEAVLAEGDEAEVSGVAAVELVSDGMRESHEIRCFRASPTVRRYNLKPSRV